MKEEIPYIVGIGGANTDIRGKLNKDAVFRDSNPGEIITTPGGVARNIIENLARLGSSCKMLTAVGSDIAGKAITAACTDLGIDMSEVLVSEEYPTGSYMALMDKDGELIISAADTAVIENIPLSYFESKKEVIQNAAAIVCDPNLETEQIEKITQLADGKRIYLDPVSGAKAEKIKDILHCFYFIKPNLIELQAISGIKCRSDEEVAEAAHILLGRGVRSVAVTLGERGCYYADRDHSLMRASFFRPKVANATGAGDAFTAGFISAQLRGFGIEKTLDYALAAGAAATESESTVNTNMSMALLDSMVNNSKENYRNESE